MLSNVLYIKLPLYVSEYLAWRYKASKTEAITLPPTLHKAGRIIYEKAVNNPLVQAMATMSFSQRAMGLTRESLPMAQQNCIPADDQRRFFTAFTLPAQHIVHGRVVQCCDTMQLKNEDASAFDKIVSEEFWNDVDQFSTTEWAEWAEQLGYKNTDYSNMLWCYMESREISSSNFDAALRVARRMQEKKGGRPCDERRKRKQHT